jgi:hypothetical protein
MINVSQKSVSRHERITFCDKIKDLTKARKVIIIISIISSYPTSRERQNTSEGFTKAREVKLLVSIQKYLFNPYRNVTLSSMGYLNLRNQIVCSGGGGTQTVHPLAMCLVNHQPIYRVCLYFRPVLGLDFTGKIEYVCIEKHLNLHIKTKSKFAETILPYVNK